MVVRTRRWWLVVVELCARETGAREGGWAKTRNRAVVQGWCDGAYMVVVVVGWCVRETQGAELVGQKNRNELPWLGFGLQWGCKRWRGLLWDYSPPPVLN